MDHILLTPALEDLSSKRRPNTLCYSTGYLGCFWLLFLLFLSFPPSLLSFFPSLFIFNYMLTNVEASIFRTEASLSSSLSLA